MNLKPKQKDALQHIADHCLKALTLAADLTPDLLTEDWQARYALILCLQIIGEAVNRLGADFEASHPAIPWRQMAGMRNRLIHGYDDVNEPILWRTINDDLPKLLTWVEDILKKSR